MATRKTTERQALVDRLDRLNAWDSLDIARQNLSAGTYGYGPLLLENFGIERPYCGVVIWFRRGGFYGYKSLQLVGVWACGEDIALGSKQLTYSAPIYNPETYHKLISKDYRPYYTDDGLPPADATIHEYTPEKRLQLRQTIVRWLASKSG